MLTGSPCRSGKTAYKDRVAARVALSDTMRNTASRRQEVRAYECPQCGKWHLSSKLVYEAPVIRPAGKAERQVHSAQARRREPHRERPLGRRT